MIVGAVLLDFSAAFDVIDHTLLLKTTHLVWLYLPTHGWRVIYPTESRVFFNGIFFIIRYLKWGIPQGSCLGPLLFSILTNYLPLVLHKTRMPTYADDFTLYSTQSQWAHWNSKQGNSQYQNYSWLINKAERLTAHTELTSTTCMPVFTGWRLTRD